MLHRSVRKITVNLVQSFSSGQTDRILGLFRAFPNLQSVTDEDITIRSFRTSRGDITSHEIVYEGYEQAFVDIDEITTFSARRLDGISLKKPVKYIHDIVLSPSKAGQRTFDSLHDERSYFSTLDPVSVFSPRIYASVE